MAKSPTETLGLDPNPTLLLGEALIAGSPWLSLRHRDSATGFLCPVASILMVKPTIDASGNPSGIQVMFPSGYVMDCLGSVEELTAGLRDGGVPVVEVAGGLAGALADAAAERAAAPAPASAPAEAEPIGSMRGPRSVR